MALTNLQYDNIRREYDADRMEADRIAGERREYVYSHIEGFRELSRLNWILRLRLRMTTLGKHLNKR